MRFIPTHSAFGFKLGRKTHLMHVGLPDDTLMCWCVNELYMLLREHGSADALKDAFARLRGVSLYTSPTDDARDKLALFSVLCMPKADTPPKQNTQTATLKEDVVQWDWYKLTHYCAGSFINLLHSGYFVKMETDVNSAHNVVLLDLNHFCLNHYSEYDRKDKNKCLLKSIPLSELGEWLRDDAPAKTLNVSDLLDHSRAYRSEYEEKIKALDEELERLKEAMAKVRELGCDQNMLDKLSKSIGDAEWKRQRICDDFDLTKFRMDELNATGLI